MEPEDYATQVRTQEGRCPICNERPHQKAHVKQDVLVVDHDHDTRKVRSPICAQCNLLLGLAEDDPKILFAAAAYLWRHKNDIPITSRFTLYAQADELFDWLDSTDFDVAVLRGRPPLAA